MISRAVLRRGLSTTATRPLRRVAVVGAGPSGFYAAKYLIKELDPSGRIDILERLG
jgi:cation diffusion facilitator CzcD-associated flavoprotein CzcO